MVFVGSLVGVATLGGRIAFGYVPTGGRIAFFGCGIRDIRTANCWGQVFVDLQRFGMALYGQHRWRLPSGHVPCGSCKVVPASSGPPAIVPSRDRTHVAEHSRERCHYPHRRGVPLWFGALRFALLDWPYTTSAKQGLATDPRRLEPAFHAAANSHVRRSRVPVRQASPE
jgi:hypothetical protein